MKFIRKACTAAAAASLLTLGLSVPAWAGQAPTNVGAVSTSDASIRLGWTGYGGTYKVYKDGAYVPDADGTNTEESISGLSACTTYSFQIEAVSATGAAKSAPVSLKTTGTCPVNYAPKGLRLDPSYTTTTSSFRMLWDVVTGSTVYKIYKNGTYLAGADGTNNTETSTGYAAGTTYSMQVSSTVNGVEYKSSPVNFTTAGTTTASPVTGAVTPNAPAEVVSGRTLSFVEEFSGTSLDRTKWSPCWFYPECGVMNNAYTPTSNVSVAGGNLVLALRSASSGSLVSTNPNGGGGLAGYTFTTGYAEARVFFPGGTTCPNWSAWWTAGQSWPSTQEIDIAEAKGGKMLANYMNSAGTWQSYAVPGTTCGGWHTYGVDRKANVVDFYYDGVKVKSMVADATPAAHYLVLNNGSGNGAPELYGAPAEVKVDYVHAWK